ncbi:MAG: polysaccharide biosynthesis C-terminal domain-containing protein, partial [Lachnospiraceae bacterium]|nr:polysaccharide biosynthesis C-terminal domain-containing protein [Lachnospiraceae bacterium]
EKIASVVKFNMIIAFPSAVGMSVLAHPILLLLFRDNRHDSTMMLRMGGICIIFFALSTVTNGVLQGINKMRLPVIHSAISLAIHVPLLIIMLKFMNLGAYSLVICNVIFPLVVCILNWRSIGKLIDYKQEVVRTFVIPCASSLLMGAITFGIYKVFALFAGNFISTMIALMAAVLSYFFFLIKLGGVTKEEMLKMPKGRTLVNMLSKIGLFKA